MQASNTQRHQNMAANRLVSWLVPTAADGSGVASSASSTATGGAASASGPLGHLAGGAAPQLHSTAVPGAPPQFCAF